MLNLFTSLGVLILVLLSVAFFSLFERKLMAGVQVRLGPNKVSVSGVAQPIADAMKLLSKVESFPENSSALIYSLSPSVMMFVSLLVWMLYPISFEFHVSSLSALLLLVYFSISVYGVVFSGWSSNSRFATLGAVRAIVQSISYEIGLSTAVVFIMVLISSFSLTSVLGSQDTCWFSFLLPPMLMGVVLCMYAEIGRSPFDLAEGESELVSGYSVEYGGGKYTSIFLGENTALIWGSVVLSTLFFGGWGALVIISSFVLVRATVPRVRYDKGMILFWLMVLPILISLGSLEVLMWCPK